MTQTKTPAKKTRGYYINSMISLLIIALFHLLPPFSTLTRTGMNVTGIFLGVIYAFSTVDIIWPALLGILLLGSTELYTMTEAFTKAFGNDTWLFILFILTFAAIINEAGVSASIANWVVSRPFSRRRPWVISWLLLTTAYVVAALVSVTPGVVITCAILYTMCENYGYRPHDRYPTLMVIGITLAGLMGNTAFPFKSLSMMVLRSLQNLTGESVTFFVYTLLAVVLSYGVVMAYLLACRVLFRPDVQRIRDSDYLYEGETKLDAYQKRVLGLLALFFLLLFLPETLSGVLPAAAALSKLGKTAVCVLLLCLAGFFVKPETGRARVDLAEMMKKGVPWPTMMLLAFALLMTSSITNQATGIQPFLQSLFEPVFGSAPNPVIFILAVCAIQLALTNVFANMVIALLLVPLVCTYAPLAGVSNVMMCVCICVLVNVSLLLPSSSPFAALLHGNSEWVTSKDIYRYFGLSLLLILPTAVLLCSTLGMLLF